MDEIYIEYSFEIKPKEPTTEILIAELGFVGFESFIETNEGLIAYIQKADWNMNILDEIFILKSTECSIQYTLKEIAQTNWNAEWEKNFDPIEVDNRVSVRAPFHANPELEFDIVIEPKMSFGTGHHETTYMMIQHLLDLELQDKSVLDMGCGTGILAIFSEMKGATSIDAIDIDPWCYENSLENVERNNCDRIEVREGDSTLLEPDQYDLIIANINRNILLADFPRYSESLHQSGVLLLSGFYSEDIASIDSQAVKFGFTLDNKIERNNWVALKYFR